MHRMVKLLCTLLLALSLTAHYSDMSMKVSADCQSVNVPGPCSPTTCDDNCKSQIGAGAVGESPTLRDSCFVELKLYQL
uniref:Uncharacterized protein n=1 Tax=Oryza sativa subsp. japonica TaxID=39947 RepID=Q6H709_ORYSJ|nr:hypothetical protein [Oryza sativa Japonica Group]BAD25490.1 hypothetical protein [Oryza sativa Japonica Group]